EIVETYKYCPEEPLPSPITVYGGLQDEHVPLEHCRAWNVQTSAGCNVRMFAGDHFFIREPQSDFIAAFRKDVVNTLPVPRLK
ncbi:MAG: thioesterase II family protein, partial [Actinomycetota bacterium]